MKILITGGAGFLGSHLCDRFLSDENEVVCMDNLSTGNIENVAHLLGNPKFKFVNYDVTEYIYVQGKLDYILHFASPASPIDYLNLPIQTLKVGSLGTHKALGLAKNKGATFLLASTSEVYGDPEIHPQPETYWGNVNSIGPRGVYDEAKRFAEALTMAYHYYHKINTRIARIFNTYGERMRVNDGRAIPAFISKALKGEDLTIFGSGSQTRSVCYVEDLINGLVKLLLSDISEPVNLGNPDEITILDLAREIIHLTESKSQIIFKGAQIDDPKVRCPDITKAKDQLNWLPNVPRKNGLEKTIRYFRGIL